MNHNEYFDPKTQKKYIFHSSRAERYAQRQNHFQGEVNTKLRSKRGIAKFFGKNRTVGRFFLLYILVMVLLVSYNFFYKQAEIIEKKRVFKMGNGKKITAVLIDQESKFGVNLLFENTSNEEWIISKTGLKFPQTNFSINLKIGLSPNEFDVYFIPLDQNVRKLSELEIKTE